MEDRGDVGIEIRAGEIRLSCTTVLQAGPDPGLIVTSLTKYPNQIPFGTLSGGVFRGDERLLCHSVDSQGNGRFCDGSGVLVVKFPKRLSISGPTKAEVSLVSIARGLSADGRIPKGNVAVKISRLRQSR
jgi:hypothetical protein